MGEESAFHSFLERIRTGDTAAAEELVRRYAPAVRLEVRMRMRDRRLNRVFDSGDICQSVMASFFVRAALGQFDLESDGDLVKLLISMARNKVASQTRRHKSQRRDIGQLAAGGDRALVNIASGPSPSHVVMAKELLEQFRNHMNDEERRLADGRAQGRSWAEIAAEVGGTPQTRCKQLARALDRIAQKLGLDDED